MARDFSYYITRFFQDYLPGQKGASEHTVASYRDAFVILIQYLASVHGEALTLNSFSKEVIENFLSWLEQERNCKISTRNQRLAAIQTFFRYIQGRAPEYYELCLSILSIEPKQSPSAVVSYLSKDEISFLLNLPSYQKPSGKRDLAILALLYDSGARVQELIELRLENLRLDNTPVIEVCGKGNKKRWIPISQNTCTILKSYIDSAFITGNSDFVFKNKQKNKLTRVGVSYIINKYIKIGKSEKPGYFPCTVSPHTFRHSKAMHLLESGVNLVYIRDFLGHQSITTTEIYAKANPEIKRKYIEENAISTNLDQSYNTTQKGELINWLKQNI